MIYIGTFSYNDDKDDKDNFCLMPCIVGADNAEQAMEKFASYFEELHQTTDLIEGASKIYLDSLTELEGVPEDPLLCQWQKIVPTVDGLCSIIDALPTVAPDEDFASAYAWDEQDSETPEDEEIEIDLDEEGLENPREAPFLRF